MSITDNINSFFGITPPTVCQEVIKETIFNAIQDAIHIHGAVVNEDRLKEYVDKRLTKLQSEDIAIPSNVGWDFLYKIVAVSMDGCVGVAEIRIDKGNYQGITLYSCKIIVKNEIITVGEVEIQ